MIVINNIIKNLFISLWILFALWALMNNLYMSWFQPSIFLERAKRALGDWPFGGHFFSSSLWLWINRIASAFIVLIILFIGYLAILGRIHIQP